MKKLDSTAQKFIDSMESGALTAQKFIDSIESGALTEQKPFPKDMLNINNERFIEILHKIRGNIESIMTLGLLNNYLTIDDVSEEKFLLLEYNDSEMIDFLKLLVKEDYINTKDYYFLLSQSCFKMYDEYGNIHPLFTLKFEHRDKYRIYACLINELNFYLHFNFSKGGNHE